jgi:hypothetical protein
MRHLEEGQLRAYHDDALQGPEHEVVRAHLAACARCARAADAVQKRSARVNRLLASLDPQPAQQPVSSQAARVRLDRYIEQKKEQAMQRNVFAPRYRPVWAAAIVIVALAIAFSFAPVRALAGNLLSLFRVQQIAFVEINPAQMPDEQTLEAAVSRFESTMRDQVDVQSDGEPRTVDEQTARAEAGFAVRLPAALEGEPSLTLGPGMHAAMLVDLPRLQSLLQELGYSDVALPASLDGAEIRVDFSTGVKAAYGECRSAGAEEGTPALANCTTLVQSPSPVVSAPPELDIDQLGRAYLQLLGMSADEAERFSQHVDWATTLVVPVPQATNLSCQEVNVDGVTGTLIRPPSRDSNGQQYLLAWVKDGIGYALSGSGTSAEALQIANSLH